MKAFCIGRNYVAHAQELQNEVPTEPVVFIKPEDSFFFPKKEKFAPPTSVSPVHYEAELVFRFSKDISTPIPDLTINNALDYVDAVTIGLDLTARDVQQRLKEKQLPWEKSKSFKHSAMLGEWLPIAAIGKIEDITFEFYLNGTLKQLGKVSHQIFGIEKLIAHLSLYFSIKAGDVIFTGTPSGVGELPTDSHIQAKLNNTVVFDHQL